MEFNTSPSFYNTSNKKYDYYFQSKKKNNQNEKMKIYCEELRNKFQRFNSYNNPLQLNNDILNDEENSKYYNIYYPRTNEKQKNTFFNRLNYNPHLSIQNEKNDNMTKLNEDEERNQLIENLVKNSKISFSEKIKNKKREESKSKENKKIQYKIEVLRKNNIDINKLFEEAVNKKNEELKGKNDRKENMKLEHLISENDINNKYCKTYTNDKNPLLHSKIKNTNLNSQNFSKTFNKRKPTVDTLEFCKTIKKYLNNEEKDSNKNEMNFRKYHSNKISFRNNSFPKKQSNTNNKSINNKKNTRGKEELQQFIKKQNQRRKENADKLLKKESKKSLNYYLSFEELRKSIDKNRKKLNKKNNQKQVKKLKKNSSNDKLSYHDSKSTILDKQDLLNAIIKSKKIINNGNGEGLNQISKEEYDNFIKNEEDKIKNGDLDLSVNSDRKENNIKNNSFQKVILSAEKTVKNSINIFKENNLNQYLKNKKDKNSNED